jgi:peptidyl-prolyl cis-trans isomerase SDCCAG10
MSQVYSTEPSTSGRVLLETSHGPLELQLWCRECPLTTRLFLQLCTDGYFDNMVFHRIVPDFLIQTGAIRQGPPQSNILDEKYRQAVQADEAAERRQYELHSRLKFNHRGQVAMALGVSEDDLELQPQFFITLDEAPYLDGKHVLFGTITGPTMFNALRIGRTEVDESDLQHAPRITSVKIIENPIFTDLVPQTHVPWKVKKEEPALVKKKKKRKGKKDFNVLSFGDELEADDLGVGMKSSHDVVVSEVLSSRVDDKVQEAVVEDSVSETKVPKQTVTARVEIVKSESHEPSAKRVKHEPEVVNPKKIEKKPISSEATVNGNHAEEAPRSFAKPSESHHLQKSTSKATSASKRSSAVEERLAKYIKKSSIDKKEREEDTMSKLLAFQGKVRKQVSSKNQKDDGEGPKDNDLAARMARKLQAEDEPREIVADAPTYHGQVLDNSDDEKEKDSWLTTKFKCRKHMDHTRGGDGADGRSTDDYRVVDENNGRRDRKRHKHHSSHRHDKGERRRNHK